MLSTTVSSRQTNSLTLSDDEKASNSISPRHNCKDESEVQLAQLANASDGIRNIACVDVLQPSCGLSEDMTDTEQEVEGINLEHRIIQQEEADLQMQSKQECQDESSIFSSDISLNENTQTISENAGTSDETKTARTDEFSKQLNEQKVTSEDENTTHTEQPNNTLRKRNVSSSTTESENAIHNTEANAGTNISSPHAIPGLHLNTEELQLLEQSFQQLLQQHGGTNETVTREEMNKIFENILGGLVSYEPLIEQRTNYQQLIKSNLVGFLVKVLTEGIAHIKNGSSLQELKVFKNDICSAIYSFYTQQNGPTPPFNIPAFFSTVTFILGAVNSVIALGYCITSGYSVAFTFFKVIYSLVFEQRLIKISTSTLFFDLLKAMFYRAIANKTVSDGNKLMQNSQTPMDLRQGDKITGRSIMLSIQLCIFARLLT